MGLEQWPETVKVNEEPDNNVEAKLLLLRKGILYWSWLLVAEAGKYSPDHFLYCPALVLLVVVVVQSLRRQPGLEQWNLLRRCVLQCYVFCILTIPIIISSSSHS